MAETVPAKNGPPEVTEEIWGPDTVPLWAGKNRDQGTVSWHNQTTKGVNRKGEPYQLQRVWPVGYGQHSKLDIGSEQTWGEKVLTVWEREADTRGPRYVAEMKIEDLYHVVLLVEFEDLLEFAARLRPLTELHLRHLERAEWEGHYTKEHQRNFDEYCPLCWQARERERGRD